MWKYLVLYRFILYYIILNYIILYHIKKLCCNVLSYLILHDIIFHQFISRHTISNYLTLHLAYHISHHNFSGFWYFSQHDRSWSPRHSLLEQADEGDWLIFIHCPVLLLIILIGYDIGLKRDYQTSTKKLS